MCGGSAALRSLIDGNLAATRGVSSKTCFVFGRAVWAIFLPGDRVRLMIADGNHEGGNNANNRPADDDPYIAQGALDDEWNRLYPNGVPKELHSDREVG
jgi:hypothetical protein